MPRRALLDKRPWLLASIIAAFAFYLLADGEWATLELALLKAAALASLAVYAFQRHQSIDAALLALVMALGALGDFGMEFDVTLGGAAFLLGHLIAIALYLRNRRKTPSTSQKILGAALLIGVPLIAWLLTAAIEVALYATALGAMAAAAWTSRFPRYRVGIGAVLFAVSDLVIFARMGGQIEPELASWLVWPIYYVGQFLICTGVIQSLRGQVSGVNTRPV